MSIFIPRDNSMDHRTVLAVMLSTAMTTVLNNVLVAASVHNVLYYGAKGDGHTDDTQAFLKGWNAVCADAGAPTLLVPSGTTFLLSQIIFSGPCKAKIHVQIDGTLKRPNVVWESNEQSWILFNGLDGLVIDGYGEINGQGLSYWDCKIRNICSTAPNALEVANCDGSTVRGLLIRNSPGMQVVLGFSSKAQINGLTVIAPGESPNTDGVHISHSQHVAVSNCVISTGDDCVSIGNGTFDVNVSRITCGPGHGISIGSLGGQHSVSVVEQIRVSYSRIFHATNGLRIKTWQGGSGHVKGITFEHINLTAVYNPIIIDQYYCPNQVCSNKTSAVAVRDVKYYGIRGTSNQRIGINLRCSQSRACTGIKMQNVIIQPASPGQQVEAYCFNSHGTDIQPVFPAVPCLVS
ncbi:probable polygalacturonase At1g80170 [Zingiber officinale]|uniref:probable polygalacturonase At1g80170 n=1 Tax=Zingiber officinale TaxID=94328 RepID=UPI001C4D3929|nr:probable polygalacturonase At1g80170 [Zingiber officinale]